MIRLVAVAILISSCSLLYAQDEIHREFKTTPGKKLEVDLKTGGSVHITGWDRDLVSVKVSGIERSEPRHIIDMEETSSGVEISSRVEQNRTNGSRSRLRFEIQVPKTYDLQLESMGGGFAIRGVEGKIGGKTMGGKLELEELRGELDLLTMGGEVVLKNSNVDGTVKTMGGKVLVDHVSGNVDATSMGGPVTQRFVTRKAGDKPTGEVKITSMGGEINVDDAPAGADLHTMGGKIHVASAAGHVKARTQGGSVAIDAVDGWVDATTNGGDVTVEMVGNPSEGRRDVSLHSNAGDISLTVPPGLSMDVDITLTYTRNKNGQYRILSDFDLTQEETPEWDVSEGRPRKQIYGTGKINGGKHKVKIKTVNGNVYLKKGK